MRHLSAAIIAAASTFAQVATAADLPRKAPAYAPPAPPVFSWTGLYVGLHAGYGWGTTTATDTVGTNGLCWFACGFQWDADVHGFVGGGQVGYNWQFAPSWVAGVEGEIGYLGVKGNAVEAISTDNTTVNTKGGFYATARGRIGFVTGATGNVLIYGTGGWIGADLRSTVQDNFGLQTDDTGFRSGWTAGGGVEWAFAPQWSIKGEWLYYDLGTDKVGFVCNLCGPGGVIQFFDIENKGNIVRAGLNYKFY